MTKRASERGPCLLDVAMVKCRRDELHLTNAELASATGVKQRTLEAWLKPDDKRRPDIVCVEKLASRLNVGTAEICAMMPDEDRALAHGGPSLVMSTRALDILRRTVVECWRRNQVYTQHVGLRFWPLQGHVRRFFNEAKLRHAYGELRILPSTRVGAAPAELIFSFRLGAIRVDYGKITLQRDSVKLTSFFTSSTDECVARPDGSFRVWIWYGGESCEIIVRSPDIDFELRVDERPVPREPRRKGPQDDDVVCFLAAPHHIAAIESERSR